MIYELGKYTGWLIVILFCFTIFNYIIKFINRTWKEQIKQIPWLKKYLAVLTKIFVKYHKYFGLTTIVFLLAHFLIQFTNWGMSISGIIASLLILVQVFLGAYATKKKLPRRGNWFIAHRLIALLMVVAILAHLVYPSVIRMNTKNSSNQTQNQDADSASNNSANGDSTSGNSSAASTVASETKTFTLNELAQYNGKNGNPAYVAYKGVVYDVSNHSQWKTGTHNRQKAGTDLTSAISLSPHGDSVFSGLPVVGNLKNN